MSPHASVTVVATPLGGAVAQRSTILDVLAAADVLKAAAAPVSFVDALELVYSTDSTAVVGTGDVIFDSRLAAAAGADHILVAAGGDEEANDLSVVPAVQARLEENGRPAAGVYVLAESPAIAAADDADSSYPVLDSAVSGESREPVICPELFERNLILQAKDKDAHIVLPEGSDDRILTAADQLLREGVCRLTILGEPDAISARAEELGLDLSAATLQDPTAGSQLEEFAAEFAELRKSKGVTLDAARETMTDISYYATMMIHKGLADGMVSGAVNTTAHTIKPSFQIIKTAPGSSVVSSIFLMVLDGNLWAFGDCAVNPNPTPEQLAEIAAVSAHTARQFGISTPRVAMLSYSTGTSGSGADVEAVAQAVELAKTNNPDLAVDGPIQFDAAVVDSVGQKKMPGSDVAGHANVFVFPDLNSGNIAYKAVQRTAGALAVGPILQGLNKPVNDLSRGATVADIVNTVAITAIQAK